MIKIFREGILLSRVTRGTLASNVNTERMLVKACILITVD